MRQALRSLLGSTNVSAAVLCAAFILSSCTTSPVPPLELALADVAAAPADPASADPAFAASEADTSQAALAAPTAADAPPSVTQAQPQTLADADAAQSEAPADPTEPAAQPAENSSDIASARVAQAADSIPVPEVAPRVGQVVTPLVAQTQTEPAEATVAALAPEPEKPRGFLASLFSQEPPRPVAAVARARTVAIAAPANSQRSVQVASLPPTTSPASVSALPGVNAESLFEINRKSGSFDDSDVDANENEGPVRVASVTGLARLAPNGLAVQTESVDVGCLKPALVKVLKTVERRYGKKVVVTSGYRSPTHNRRARGAKNSLHMYCAAVDVQISGVSKWDLAKYVRSMPGRGGVGTYCHTESVHIDIGPERDWNWRCRRGKRKK